MFVSDYKGTLCSPHPCCFGAFMEEPLQHTTLYDSVYSQSISLAPTHKEQAMQEGLTEAPCTMLCTTALLIHRKSLETYTLMSQMARYCKFVAYGTPSVLVYGLCVWGKADASIPKAMIRLITIVHASNAVLLWFLNLFFSHGSSCNLLKQLKPQASPLYWFSRCH